VILWLVAPVSALLVTAAIFDVRTMRLPNLISLAIALLALINSLLAGGLAELGWFEALIGFVLGLTLYLAKQIGAGDVKLAASCLLWFPGRGIDFIFITSVLGLIVAVIYLIITYVKHKQNHQIPYGVAISGAAVSLMWLPLAWS
jgi:prepilin peptidase CpaA